MDRAAPPRGRRWAEYAKWKRKRRRGPEMRIVAPRVSFTRCVSSKVASNFDWFTPGSRFMWISMGRSMG
eukprot:3010103-Prymnesium_polylepis.2